MKVRHVNVGLLTNNWWKNFDDEPHRRGRIFVCDNVGHIAFSCSSRAVMPISTIVISLFAAYTAAETPKSSFSKADNPQNCPFLWEISSHLIHGSLAPCKSAPQTASRSVHPFLCSLSVFPTDRHKTTLLATSLDFSNRPHLCNECDVA